MEAAEGEPPEAKEDIPPADCVLDNLCASCRRCPREPKLLSCLHTMCEVCVEQCYWPTQRVIRCTLCSQDSPLPPAGLIRALPTNALPLYAKEEQAAKAREDDGEEIERMCEECMDDEAQPAVVRCIDCKLMLLCSFHATSHRKSRTTARHTLDEDIDQAGQAAVSVQCSMHAGQRPTCFCKDCGRLICANCLVRGEHDRHTTISISEAALPERQRLRERASSVRTELLVPLKAAAESAKETVEQVNDNAQDESRKIEDVFRVLRNILDIKEQQLINEVDEVRQRKLRPLEEQEAELRTKSKRLESAVLFTDKCVEKLTDADFLEVSSTLDAALQQTPRKSRLTIPFSPPIAFEPNGVDELKVAMRKEVGVVTEEMPLIISSSTSPHYPNAPVTIHVHRKEESKLEVDTAAVVVSIDKPDGCQEELTVSKVDSARDSTRVCIAQFTPVTLGKYSVSVVTAGLHARGSPLAVSVIKTPSHVRFHPCVYDSRHVAISGDRCTATCIADSGDADVTCGPGFITGRHRWTLRMTDYDSSSGQLCGIATTADDGNASRVTFRHKFGYARWGGAPYAENAIVEGNLPAWAKGDLVSFELNCDRRMLTATHRPTGRIARIANLPFGEKYFVYFNLHQPPTSVTFVDEK